jgi:putative PEP-CTERM system TPR-repeat lipoprotein
VQIFQDWITAHPADMKAKIALAGILVQQKDFAGAIKLLTGANVLTAGSAGDGLQLVEIYEIQHDWQKAIGTAKSLQTRFPNDQSVADTLGRLYAESGDLQSSVAVYAKATVAFPQAASIWNNYATALSRMKNFSAALDAISKAHGLAPANVTYQRGLIGMTYQVKGQAAALAVGQTFPGNTARSPVAAVLTADAMAKAGKVADAIALLEATQTKSPSPDSVMLLAKYYQVDNQAPKAIAVLEAWTIAHPIDVDARFGLAQLYGSAANYPKALAEFEWLATRRPTDAVVANNLAWLYSQKGDPRARAMGEKAFSLAPQSSAVADTLGWILENQGDTAGALKYLKIAGSEAPDDQGIQYHLAYALTKMNQPADARPILRKLVNSSTADGGIRAQAKQLLEKIGS